MSAQATIYAIGEGATFDSLTVTNSWTDTGGAVAEGLSAFCAMEAGGNSYLLAMSPKSELYCYQVESDGSGVTLVYSQQLKQAYDILRIFPMGGAPHLPGYASKSGQIDAYRFNDELNVEQVLSYARTYGAVTSGFTTIETYQYNGMALLLAYNMVNGDVAIYQLQVPSDSAMSISEPWSHNWAEGWTRFTLFGMGNENFFLKSNIKYKSAYIDHLNADPTQGSTPVGRHLPLSLELDVVQAFPYAGNNYFLTYKADTGSATLEHIDCDCQGWSQAAGFTAVTGASVAVPILVDGKAPMLFLY